MSLQAPIWEDEPKSFESIDGWALTAVPSFNIPYLSAKSTYAGYWVVGSIQPFPIAAPRSGTASRADFNIASAAERDDRCQHGMLRVICDPLTKIRDVLSSVTLSREVCLIICKS